MYQLKFHPRVKKQVKKLHPTDQKRFFTVLPRLAKNPFSKNLSVKKLVNTKSAHRLRIGDFRIIYSLDKKTKIIYVWEVAYRGSIY